MRCDENITEDHDHIWQCQNTIEQEEDIYERAVELFHDELEATSILCCREDANRTMSALGLSPRTILETPLTSGIITRKHTRKGLEIAKILPNFRMKWIPILSASLTRALWEIVWNPRTAQIQRIQEQMEAIADEEERQFERQREAKRKEILKEKGLQKRILLAELRKDKVKLKEMVTARAETKRLLRAESQTNKPNLRKRKLNSTANSSNAKKTKIRKEQDADEIPILPEKRKAAADLDHCTTAKRQRNTHREPLLKRKRKAPISSDIKVPDRKKTKTLLPCTIFQQNKISDYPSDAP
jgi:hypothetical protein